MKRTILFIVISVIACTAIAAQRIKSGPADSQTRAIEDRMAIKELVDTFSILADKKDTKAQVLLFTSNGRVKTYRNGSEVSNLTGRDKMETAFAAFLKNFDTVYHFNGQHAIRLNGDDAAGTLYCLVTLIGPENGKRMITTIGVIYNDEYVRENGRWLIAKRTSYFTWQNKSELQQ